MILPNPQGEMIPSGGFFIFLNRSRLIAFEFQMRGRALSNF
jgi:hypothetical protein